MSAPRLTAEFWVQAYLARLRLAEIPAFVTARGDATAGAVVVKLNTLDGRAQAFARSYDVSGARVWAPLAEGPEAEVDAALAAAAAVRPRPLGDRGGGPGGAAPPRRAGAGGVGLGAMDWRDEGILIAARRHGESSAIVEVFTAGHGRHAGVVRGGAGRRMTPVLQPGARLSVEWSARLEEHIGTLPGRSDAVADGGDHGRPPRRWRRSGR